MDSDNTNHGTYPLSKSATQHQSVTHQVPRESLAEQKPDLPCVSDDEGNRKCPVLENVQREFQRNADENDGRHSAGGAGTTHKVELTSKTTPDSSLARKFGKMGIFLLTAGTVIVAGAIGFLGFLWFSNADNPTWHAIVIRDWLVKAVTICAEAIKQAVTFQVGLCGAMLAALIMERFQVQLSDAASISMMRTGIGSGHLLSLSKKRFHSKCFRCNELWFSSLILIATAILGLFQLTSIVLISDVALVSVPGKPATTDLAIGFTYDTVNYTNVPQSDVLLRGSTWSRKPPFYPTFAEYTEQPVLQDGVSDTGLTLRAFLPFSAAQDRQNIRKYEGKTTVLDARVTCQVPLLTNESLLTPDLGSTMIFAGSVQATRITPRLQNVVAGYFSTPSGNEFYNYWNDSVPFQCLAPTADSFNVNYSPQGPWRITLCQLGRDTGGLGSEFQSLDSLPEPGNFSQGFEGSESYGTSYLVLNVTLGSSYNWSAVTQGSKGVSPPAYSENGEWMDLVYSNGDLIISVTLCYSAFHTADIPVSISSEANRTEPTTLFDFAESVYTFSDIRDQLGQAGGALSLEDRGILQLDKRESWIANGSELPPVEPFVRDYANLGGPTGNGNDGNYTAFLWQGLSPDSQDPQFLVPDVMHIWLFQEIITTGGSMAFALQSMITMLSGMAYYDQIGQFDNKQTVQVVYYVTANVPRHYWGFLAVSIALAAHLVLTAIVVVHFAKGTRFSMLGNTWQAIAQTVTEETRIYLEKAQGRTDTEVRDVMKDDGVAKIPIGIAHIDGSVGSGVTQRPAAYKRVSNDESGTHRRRG